MSLTLLRLRPDRAALARWAARHRLVEGDDTGYAWHGALRAVYGDAAPRPFVDRLSRDADELLAYSTQPAPALLSRLQQADLLPLLRLALQPERADARVLPTQFASGRELSFEVRVRPVRRSRQGARSGSVDEIDVAVPAALQGLDRESAYVQWLTTELARGEAAVLLGARLQGFRRLRVQRVARGAGQRHVHHVEGPDAWMQGHLRVRDSAAFAQLLERGIGRHRAFGYGCLLLARPGVLA